MAKIERLSTLHIADERHLERIVSAARADPGFWLMVKEREMELRTMRAELRRLGDDESEIDHLFPKRLKPTLSDLADELVTRMFGGVALKTCWCRFRMPCLLRQSASWMSIHRADQFVSD